MRRALLLAALPLLAGCAAARPSEPSLFCRVDAEGPCRTPAQEEAEPLLRAVLDQVLSDGDYLPDRKLLPAAPPLLVREEIGRSGLVVSPRAVASERGFAVWSRDRIQRRADERREDVYFVSIESLEVGRDSAEVVLGVDFVVPNQPKDAKLSCCTARHLYERVGGQWRFVRGTELLCA